MNPWHIGGTKSNKLEEIAWEQELKKIGLKNKYAGVLVQVP